MKILEDLIIKVIVILYCVSVISPELEDGSFHFSKRHEVLMML